jgi:hypothetical protein
VAWPGRVVIHHLDGTFSLADAAGVRPLAMPATDWWLGSGSADGRVLLFPVEAAGIDAALVAIAADGTASLDTAIGDGSRLAGAGCRSPSGNVALAALLDGALALVDGEARTAIEFGGHGSLGECAWLSDDALVAPANHDHALLYFHRAGSAHGHAEHVGSLRGVSGRYPSAGGRRLSLTTGDAEDEAISIWDVGPIIGDGSSPPRLDPHTVLRPGDGPRRGRHALSGDGRWLAAAGTQDGRSVLWIFDMEARLGTAAATIELDGAADRIAFIGGAMR